MATAATRMPRTETRRVRRRPRHAVAPAPAAYLALVGLVTTLCLLGLVMVLSASNVQAMRDHGSSWYVFNRQLLWVALGAVTLVVASRIDYRRLRRVGGPLLVVSCALLVLVLIPGVGLRVGGSARWLGAGPFRMQPSELAKFGLLLFAADLLARRADRIRQTRLTLRPVVGAFGVVAVLLMIQPDLGTTLVTGMIVMSVLFVAGIPLPAMAALLSLSGIATLVLARVEPYRWRRMTAFLDPFADVSNTGYQAAQGRVALASGGLTGVGLGASRAKWGFLPAAHTDFIFAIIGEELGLVGTIAVVALFVAFAVFGVQAAVRAPDRFGSLLAAGVTAWIVGQAFVNMGAVAGLLPITGVPLPFVSAGGSSLVVLMAATGVLLNITRQAREPRVSPSRVASEAAAR